MIERVRVSDLAGLKAAYEAMHQSVRLTGPDRFYAWAADLAGAGPGCRALDVACGLGGMVRVLRQRGVAAVGVDLSESALVHARGLPRACADGGLLPFKDGAFDLVLCLGSLEHFLDPKAGAREIARVLAPGGRAWVMLPNAWYSGAIWRLATRWRLPDHHQPVDRLAGAGEWRALLTAGGLVCGRTVRYDKFKAWKRVFPTALAYHFLFECRRP